MSTNTMSVRDAIKIILGRDAAEGIMRDCGDEWAVFVALAMIEGNGGPRNETERRFLDWHDRSKLDDTQNQLAQTTD